MKLLTLALLQSLLLAFGQIFLKIALQRMAPIGWNTAFARSFLLNWQFAICGLCYLACALLWMYIIKNFPLSQSYPLVSLSFVFGIIASEVIFHENVGMARWIGVLFIMVGCMLIATPVRAQNQSEAAFHEISVSTRSVSVIQCDFTQTKTSRMLTKPVESSGHLTISGGRITLKYAGQKTVTIPNISVSDMQDTSRFKTTVTGTAQQWTIIMQPLEKRLARMYSLITLYFNRRLSAVDRIDMVERNGSTTEIRLSNIHKTK